MTLKQAMLGLMTVIAIAIISLSLLNSWHEPQIQSQLGLYQTNLVLDAAEWQAQASSEPKQTARNFLIGADAYRSALEQYQEIRKLAQKNLDELLDKNINSAELKDKNQPIIDQLKVSLDQLDLKIGILQAKNNEIKLALTTWQNLSKRQTLSSTSLTKKEPDQATTETATSGAPKIKILAPDEISKIADILQGMWSDPVQILPDAEPAIKLSLNGWFRYQGLRQLYQLQQRQEAIETLESQQQIKAEDATLKLSIIAGFPICGLLIGTGLIIFAGIQFFRQKEDSFFWKNQQEKWEIPWEWETILQVIVGGFLLVGQVVLPLLVIPVILQVLQLDPQSFDNRNKAFYILTTYLMLAGSGLLVLYFSVAPFVPLWSSWFQFKLAKKGVLWGIGGYFMALPLVVIIALINNQLWEGNGGSNPILPIALSSADPIALIIFFITASIAAPVFEEIMFGGFLLPSLTKYMPKWGAIGLSALLFAVVHLQLSEILPLAMLGIVLGFVYVRSTNLLSPILLHSLWNSGTLLSLYILGSGN